MLLNKVIILPLDNKNHKERYSLFLWKNLHPGRGIDWDDTLNNFVGRIDLPPFRKKKGKWVSEVTIKNNGLLPFPVPDCELWAVLINEDHENVSPEFNIDWEYV